MIINAQEVTLSIMFVNKPNKNHKHSTKEQLNTNTHCQESVHMHAHAAKLFAAQYLYAHA